MKKAVYFSRFAVLLGRMNSMDGVNQAPKFAPESRASLKSDDLKKAQKTAEDYVLIANRLAAQRETPKPGPQLDSIFDQLRGRLPR